MQKYQNLTDQELFIPNVGIVSPNGTIETDHELNTPKLQRITNQPSVEPTQTPVHVEPQQVQAIPEPQPEGEQ